MINMILKKYTSNHSVVSQHRLSFSYKFGWHKFVVLHEERQRKEK